MLTIIKNLVINFGKYHVVIKSNDGYWEIGNTLDGLCSYLFKKNKYLFMGTLEDCSDYIDELEDELFKLTDKRRTITFIY